MLEITIQRRVDKSWPVVVEHHRAGALLPVRSEGYLRLADEPTDVSPRSYGTTLGKALFRDTVRDAFGRARNESAGGVRILVFVEAEELKTWRWEWLCGPVDDDVWDFLSLDQRMLFSLYLPSLTDRAYPPIGRHDLRALVVVAGPVDPKYKRLASFNVEGNILRLQSIFGDELPVKVLALAPGAAGAPTLEEIVRHLTTGAGERPYTILHLVCHGWVNPSKALNPEKETTLYLEQSVADPVSSRGLAQPVNGSDLIERLRRVARLPYLIFLSTCESAAPEAEQRIGGLAQRLVRELGIPAVIGMTERVTIATAHALADEFYRRLLAQVKVGEVDRALVEAFAGLATRPDVNVPALYSRLGAQPLFSLALDRRLAVEEVRSGLQQLDTLLVGRAPVLRSRLTEKVNNLKPLLGTDPDVLTAPTRQEWEAALTEINELCHEAVEISFNALAQGEQPPAYDSRQPFRGLSPFRAEDREFFFGREVLVQKLEQKLNGDNFLPVLGPSGSGKSSLVLAGLVPRLKEQVTGLQVIDDLTPGSTPMEQLRIRQAKLNAGPVLYIVDQFEELFTLCKDEKQRQDFIEEILRLADSNQVVLTMRADFWGECASYQALKERMQARQELIAPMTTSELRGAMEQQAAKVGLRFEADLSNTILDEVAGEPGAMPLLQHALLELWKCRHGRWLRAEEYRTIGGVRKAIAETADRLYNELGDEDRKQQQLTASGNQQTPSQERMRDIFIRLTHLDDNILPGEERRDTRRRVSLADLVPAGAEPEPTKILVKRFADAILVITSWNEATKQEQVEVVHEALIHYWRKLRQWLEENLSQLRLRETISEASVEWEIRPEDESLLVHRGTRLQEIVGLVQENRLPLTKTELKYVEACKELKIREDFARAEQQRREIENLRERNELAEKSARGLRRRSMIAIAAALISIVGGCLALYELKTAEHESQQEREALAVSYVNEADLSSSNSPGIALAQLARALRTDPKSAGARLRISELLLNNTFVLPFKNTLKLSHDVDQNQVKRLNQLGNCNMNYAGFYVPSFQLFATEVNYALTTSVDGTAQVRDLASGRSVGLPIRPKAPITTACFSLSGRRLATVSQDHSVRVWDSTSGKAVGPEVHYDSTPKEMALDADGHRIVTLSDDIIQVWNAETGRPIGPARKTPGLSALSSDGRLLITGSVYTAQVSNVETGEPVGSVLKLEERLARALFSPDGRYLATTSSSTTAGSITQVWDVETGQPIGSPLQHEVVKSFDSDGQELITNSGIWRINLTVGANLLPPMLHQRSVQSAAFSPDGLYIVTSDGSVQLWDAKTGKPFGVPFTPGVGPGGPAFSPDGSRLATPTETGVQIWDTETQKPIGPTLKHNSLVSDAEFSSDGRLLVTASYDGSARIWNVETGKPFGLPLLHKGEVETATFSPDVRLVVTASADSTAQLWDVDTSKPKGPPLKHHERVGSATFSPDGQRVVTSSQDGTAQVWSTQTSRPISKALRHEDQPGFPWSAVFSPDGRRVATASIDGTAQIWDVETSLPVGPQLRCGDEDTHSAVFSPDGMSILTASTDGGAQIWEVESGHPIGPSMHQNGGVNVAVFSPDGRRVLTASADKTAQVWQVLLGSGSTHDVSLLITLAEIAGGYRINNYGAPEQLTFMEWLREIEQLRAEYKVPQTDGTIQWFVNQLVSAGH